MSSSAYRGLRPLYGDLHNHCNISYGRGDLEEAHTNARLQLDFASVTGHAHWPDMPPAEGRLEPLVAYHEWGFDRLASLWEEVQATTERFHEEGRFATFLSFEWHSMRYGDYCIYFKGSRGEIIRAPDIEAMRYALARLSEAGSPAMMIPHHICYLEGYRGVAWGDFDGRFSPVVEIVSMHGCGEDDDAPRPYLHSMGPRDGRSSMLHGLRSGRRFGVIGSTDHHSAHPGSHGHGRLAVWASEISRDAIWEAIQSRRTYALTGDRIALAFSLNGVPMGAEASPDSERGIEVDVTGGASIDYVEIVKNGRLLARKSGVGLPDDAPGPFTGKATLAVGWGEMAHPTDWTVMLGVRRGRLLSVEPRLRGVVSLLPGHTAPERYSWSSVKRTGEQDVHLSTRTWPNPNTSTDGTQRITLEIEGDGETEIVAEINGTPVSYRLSDLREGPRTGYLDGFVSEAFQLSRAVPESEYRWRWELDDRAEGKGTDFYYARVRQKNDEWAWSSPIWIASAGSATSSEPPSGP
jgi:hypothetical protein